MYVPLRKFDIDKQGLIDYYYANKDRIMETYSWTSEEKGKWEADDKFQHEESVARPYYVSKHLTFENYGDIFNKYMPEIKCKSYEYIQMPPDYYMDIHIDNFTLGSRIGVLLEGTAGLTFYFQNGEQDFQKYDEYDYKNTVLFDIRQYHNVQNSNEWRLSFFINFEETYGHMYDKMRKYF